MKNLFLVIGFILSIAFVGCATQKVNTTQEQPTASTEASAGLNRGIASEHYPISKVARKNDVADQYILEADGDFYRIYKGNKCQITNRVESFKVSQHPTDKAMVYFERDNDLYVLHNASGFDYPCPKASTKAIMQNVRQYTVVPNTNSYIVNVALDEYGHLKAWEDNKMVTDVDNVADFKMNPNYGVKGAPFSSYALFALHKSGYVAKIKGQIGEGVVWDQNRRYETLSQFMSKNNIN